LCGTINASNISEALIMKSTEAEVLEKWRASEARLPKIETPDQRGVGGCAEIGGFESMASVREGGWRPSRVCHWESSLGRLGIYLSWLYPPPDTNTKIMSFDRLDSGRSRVVSGPIEAGTHAVIVELVVAAFSVAALF
jgi:hypothetical protein